MELRIKSLPKGEFGDLNHRIDTRLGYLHHGLRAASLCLMICVGSAAEQVRAQDSRTAEPSTKECPDLTGTYESRSTAWIATLNGSIRTAARSGISSGIA